uniref:Uncharacterized protein n=1 Tax=Babesia bovis TaxID=5865 RepID=S6CAP9_BABBO|nr:hypothetical protein [Babesia bovis]
MEKHFPPALLLPLPQDPSCEKPLLYVEVSLFLQYPNRQLLNCIPLSFEVGCIGSHKHAPYLNHIQLFCCFSFDVAKRSTKDDSTLNL